MTLSDRLALLTADHAELLAAARAAVAGQRLGEGDPLIHVRHVLDRHGQLPPEGARPVALLSIPIDLPAGHSLSQPAGMPLCFPARGSSPLRADPTRGPVT